MFRRQSQLIDPAFLPVTPSTTFIKKADLAFGFDPWHEKVRKAIDPFTNMYPETRLSHTTDSYTSTIPLVCGIEVKQSSGNSIEALAQLGVWCAAVLRKTKSLAGHVAYQNIPPALGWTVVGHDWPRIYYG